MDEYPTTVEMAEFVVTCHTVNCFNEGHAVRAIAEKAEPVVQCGPCGVIITDIKPL